MKATKKTDKNHKPIRKMRENIGAIKTIHFSLQTLSMIR